jgi:hypothetical protein
MVLLIEHLNLAPRQSRWPRFTLRRPAALSAADPPDGSNRADPEGPTRRGRPDPADFAGTADPRRGTLKQAIIQKAADLLSGPGGLASFLRTRQLGARLAGPSLPLDIGYATTIPPGIRNAVILRDKKCRGPAGATSPPRPAKCTTSSTRPAAAPPASGNACCCARSITRSSSGRHPPVGLDADPQPRRHHYRVEPRPDQDPAQPRTPGPCQVNPGTGIRCRRT